MKLNRIRSPWIALTSFVLLVIPGVTGCSSPQPGFAATFQHGAVAADHELASQAGAEMLRLGGNAVDAAVATSFCLSVVRPESCGIGGGGFMVIHFSFEGMVDQKRRGRDVPRDVALNYREMCPSGVGPDYYEKDPDPHASTKGGKAVGIPGTVAGLLTALDKYGTLDRAKVLAPAIRAAERGFVADQHFVNSAQSVMKGFEKNPGWKDRFRFVWVRFCREGKIQVGDTIKLPEQAAALRLIAEQGAAAFYQGSIAQAMTSAIAHDGGTLSQDDLGKFQVASVEPLKFKAFRREFITMPPPSSGGVALAEAMGITERLWKWNPKDPERKPSTDPIADAYVAATLFQLPMFSHPLVEAMKHAFADRAEWMGDPAFVDVPVARLTSSSYLDDRAATFRENRTLAPSDYGSHPAHSAAPDHGTSHLSVVDGFGNAVACTETINLEFGSCLAVDTFGFLLNNQMDDFTTKRGKPNAFKLVQSERNLPAPGKRPLSSMTPTIALDDRGRVEFVAGASGGPRIITGTMQVLLNAIVANSSAAAAVQAPRLHHQWSPDIVMLEPEMYDHPLTYSEGNKPKVTLIEDLQRRGHRVERSKDDVGNVQLIARDPRGGWQAACDPRKGGKPAGY